MNKEAGNSVDLTKIKKSGAHKNRGFIILGGMPLVVGFLIGTTVMITNIVKDHLGNEEAVDTIATTAAVQELRVGKELDAIGEVSE